MLEKIDRLLTMYEENHISRRQLLGALLMASVAAPRAADANQQTSAAPEGNLTGAPPPKDALFHGQLINHVTFSANDIDETRTFYQELIGATVDGRYATPDKPAQNSCVVDGCGRPLTVIVRSHRSPC